jgi:hypothetical protein
VTQRCRTEAETLPLPIALLPAPVVGDRRRLYLGRWNMPDAHQLKMHRQRGALSWMVRARPPSRPPQILFH